jgi:hypothetical protein
MADKLDPVLVPVLHAAIDGAIGPGGCSYAFNAGTHIPGEESPSPLHVDVAGCVIGQLAHLRGVPVQTLLQWGPNDAYLVLERDEPGAREALAVFPPELLKDLQYIWDTTDPEDVYEGRLAMKDCVHEYRTGRA